MRPLRSQNTLHIRLGRWFEATASGWGVVGACLLVAGLLAAAWFIGPPLR